MTAGVLDAQSYADARLHLSGIGEDATFAGRLMAVAASFGVTLVTDQLSGLDRSWRFETVSGQALFDRFALAGAWNRPPYSAWLRLVDRSGGPHAARVIGQARIGSRGSYGALVRKAADTAAILLRQALAGTPSLMPANDTDRMAASPDEPSGRVWSLPGGWVRHLARRLVVSLCRESWSVGIAGRDAETIEATGDLGAVSWLTPERGVSILADPFAWPGRNDVLCEEMRPGEPGKIVLLRGADHSFARGDVLIEGPGHLSYPCTYAADDAIYVVPESIDADATCIWRLGAFGDLVAVATIAPGARLADPTLFDWQGRFWLAATDLAIGPHDNLCLWHADRIDGPWRPHRANPVKLDIVSARPAGTPFVSAGRLIRPAQDCAAAYGAAVVLNEVVELSPERFRERMVARLVPDPYGPFPHGLHTLSRFGDRTLVDGKRLVPQPGALLRRIGRRLTGERPPPC